MWRHLFGVKKLSYTRVSKSVYEVWKEKSIDIKNANVAMFFSNYDYYCRLCLVMSKIYTKYINIK